MICRNTAAEKSLLRQRVRVPTPEEDIALITAAQSGNIQARNELIVRHLPIILTIAGQYHAKKERPTHVEIEDLAHVCVFGVIHAIRKYDVRKAMGRFIAYAKYWMRHYMDKAMNEYEMIRVPASTRFAYEKGKLSNPATKKAIESAALGLLSDPERILDERLTPLEAAIYEEECELAGLLTDRPGRSRR